MSYAICVSCGRETYWRAGRGTRLVLLRCPACGGELRGKTAGRPSAATGRHYEVCSVCGKKRLTLTTTTRAWTLWDGREIPSGSRVCGWHTVEFPDPDFVGGFRLVGVRLAEAKE